MPSPFPGMDLYLEYPVFWSSFHTRLMVAIAEAIEPQLSSQYYVEVESRTYQTDDSDHEVLIGIPDAIVFANPYPNAKSDLDADRVSDAGLATALPSAHPPNVATQVRPEKVAVPMPLEVKQRYLEVREMATDAVITVIELLSPTNKRKGEGRNAYETKRRLILGSNTHLVELDLLRGALPMTVKGARGDSPYRILISRSHQRPAADLYSVDLRQPLPNFPIPLKPGDAEPEVPLQSLVNQVYERARYATRIDYRQPLPPPALSALDQQWVADLLAPLRAHERQKE